ncbi:siderophore biosynthesis protein-like protein [Aaosphaeria arxii CBS 175.79]|uniref:Siderophore biosynthesis protein-like protein n=1 Tax=Aaosphaeria arxii CBS 175.79 TaxID=1450172 RepID=A0A6A5Y711_9PLEO|nr:siderophore biosynthesis protein-like protein [Aaosphaeria arxii CBS 175.79]KAF2020817.1 siderophore biosynthesis protein-like protein [Aaosphaeria arxii CBS 175.79]
MAPSIVHLPNGQNITVTPVFGGLFFKPNDLLNHPRSPFPPGWTIIIHSEDDVNPEQSGMSSDPDASSATEEGHIQKIRHHVHRFRKPTLQNDHLYISSISNPSASEFKPAASPTRQLAMMLWATLYWYFHQTEPDLHMTTNASKDTAEHGKPKGEWKITINREGIFKGRVVLPKLERMGLIASEDSSVGIANEENSPEGWTNMFVSRRSFWQMDPRIYLFTLSPMPQSPYPLDSPYPSRPCSPVRGESQQAKDSSGDQLSPGLWAPTAPGPFHSTSHLPTYFPPAPPQYTFSNHVRHPIRPKPPRQGEVFYTRFIPSVGQYLSFRVASLSTKPPRHQGPTSLNMSSPRNSMNTIASTDSILPTIASLNLAAAGGNAPTSSIANGPSDLEYIHKWMNEPRVSHFWGQSGPQSHQEECLKSVLRSKNCFPVIGCWDGKPFGYFEIYWVKEDDVGRHVPGAGDYDRGFHCLVGEQEFRGPHRVKVWISALVHYCWTADLRTESVMLEPRVDNAKLRDYLVASGFYKEREISLPHKQSNLMKIRRDAWQGPAL